MVGTVVAVGLVMAHDTYDRPLWDTTRGIVYEPHHLRPKFWVRCLECGELFGPYFKLAEAQSVSYCCDCDKVIIRRLSQAAGKDGF